jgi:hypothetical protein
MAKFDGTFWCETRSAIGHGTYLLPNVYRVLNLDKLEKDFNMKKLLLISAIGLTALSSAAFAAEDMTKSKYCETNTFDVLCMKPEMLKMRDEMMAMTKDKVMANRSKYCTEHASDNDPICKPEMMNDATGY